MSIPPIHSTNTSSYPLHPLPPPQPQPIKPSDENYSSSPLTATHYSPHFIHYYGPSSPLFTHYSFPTLPPPQPQPIKHPGGNYSSPTPTFSQYSDTSSPPSEFPALNFYPPNPPMTSPNFFPESSTKEYSNTPFSPEMTPYLPSSSSAAPPGIPNPGAFIHSRPAPSFTSMPSFAPQPLAPNIPSAQPIVTNPPSYQIKQEYLAQFHPFESQNPSFVTVSHYAKEAKSTANQPRNRYLNIIPYQRNIFKFQNPALYFNASSVLRGRAISCQGPLKNEHAHFWRMVWESKTTAIVMLTDLVEKGVNKCSWYLPAETGAKVLLIPDPDKGAVTIVTQTYGPPKPTSTSTSNSMEFFQRRIELDYKGEKRIVFHYHLRGWGDFTAAPHLILATIVKFIWNKHFSRGEHIIAHCSAGVGRAGTFLAILGALSELRNTPLLTNLVINIVKQLRSLDDGRVGMVQTAEQYGLIFKTLAVLDADCAREFCVQPSF